VDLRKAILMWITIKSKIKITFTQNCKQYSIHHKCQIPYEYQKHVVGPSMLVNMVRDKITSLYLVCTVGCDDICRI